jgi:phosphoribosylformimino-5-aminoimidazole carboxamide ribotide isomerase
MTIIPAIDIIDGKCVRLSKGDYASQIIYNQDPLESAKQFEGAGLQRLHLVDLDGAKASSVRNWKVLERIASNTNLKIDFSGGLSSKRQVRIAFDSGAWYACIGSMAARNEKLIAGWILCYGADRFIIAADVRDEKVMIRGWTESTEKSVFDMIEIYKSIGVKQFICTDIEKDGMLTGPSVDLYRRIHKKQSSVTLIASGGVGSVKDLDQLKKAGCSAVIIGKAIYENRIKLSELC